MTIEQFFKAKNQIVGLFRNLGWSSQATDAVVLLLQMQVFYKKPVNPSYQWVADQVDCCPKTVARIIRELKEQNQIRVKRLVFNGRRSVNRIDLRNLIYWIKKALGTALYRRPTWVQMVKTPNGILVKFCFTIRHKGGEYLPSWWQGEFPVPCFRTGKTSLIWRRFPELVR